jgi:hypothetical protein
MRQAPTLQCQINDFIKVDTACQKKKINKWIRNKYIATCGTVLLGTPKL